MQENNGELPHAAEHKRSRAVLRDTTLVLGDHPMTLKLHRQVSAYNYFTNGDVPDLNTKKHINPATSKRSQRHNGSHSFLLHSYQ